MLSSGSVPGFPSRYELHSAATTLKQGGKLGAGEESHRGRLVRSLYRTASPRAGGGGGGGGGGTSGEYEVPGAKGCYYCWVGEFDKCTHGSRPERPQQPVTTGTTTTPRRSVRRARSRSKSVPRGGGGGGGGGVPCPPQPPAASASDQYLQEVAAAGYLGSAGHTGWSTNPVFRRTSYAQQSERVQVTPYSSVNVFPEYHTAAARVAAHSGGDVLRGAAPRRRSVARRSASMAGGGGGGTPHRTPRRRGPVQPSFEEQEVIRALEAGWVTSTVDLPMPNLFAMSP